MENRVINAAILGAGTVGGGVYKLAQAMEEDIFHKTGARLVIKKMLVRNVNKERKGIPSEILTDDWNSIINDPEIDIIVELMGGITPAKKYVIEALNAGKQVVTANKDLLAEYGEEVMSAAEKSGNDLQFEAAVAGAIPIIRPLKQSMAGNHITEVMGIVNGTTRFKIIVTHTHGFDNAVWHSDSINHWKECTKSYCDKSDGYKIQEISHTCEYTYTWSDDYKTCTAVRKCSICEYTDSETAASDIVVVQNRDCTNPEIIEYVARFKNSLYNDFETQIKGNFEAAPATGHNMSEWTSNRDNTHSRICTNSGCT